jgi:glycosyltransferase involved in cell wall biosynthesis
MKSVLVTIPVRNEAAMLEATYRQLVRGLDQSGLKYRMSIAEDGSTDGTPAVIQRLKAEFPNLLVTTGPARLGRGLALRQMWSEVDADVYAFVDADLAAGPPALISVISEVQNGADVATGSRYCLGAQVRRPPLRQLVSQAYNLFVRLTFGENIRDHQCGLKAFTRQAKERLFEMSREDSWAWDTEVMVLAKRSGMRVVEVPVEWSETRWTRTPIRRLLSDVYLHGTSILRLKSGLEETMRLHRISTPTQKSTGTVDLVSPKDKGSGFVR